MKYCIYFLFVLLTYGDGGKLWAQYSLALQSRSTHTLAQSLSSNPLAKGEDDHISIDAQHFLQQQRTQKIAASNQKTFQQASPAQLFNSSHSETSTSEALPFLSNFNAAIISCTGQSEDDYAIGIIDLNTIPESARGSAYSPEIIHLPGWKRSQIGDIFGIAAGNEQYVYLAATNVYGKQFYGRGGPGGIYRLDLCTGIISVAHSISASRASSLGNICYDPVGDMIYVTVPESGLIYYFTESEDSELAGALRPNTSDAVFPLVPTTNFVGIRSIAVFEDKLFFSHMNDVYYLKRWSGGSPWFNYFEAAQLAAKDIPNVFNINDITFDPNGDMYVAEGYPNSVHARSTYRLTRSAENCCFWDNPQEITVGRYTNGRNTSGGIGIQNRGEEQILWSGGNALIFGEDDEFVYGMTGIPLDLLDNTRSFRDSRSFFLDFDGNTGSGSSFVKGDIGSVDLFQSPIPISSIGIGTSCNNSASCEETPLLESAIRNQKVSLPTKRWNADVPINFNDVFQPNVPESQVEWYIQNKITSRYEKVADPTNYFFNTDGKGEWGKLRLKPVYVCGNQKSPFLPETIQIEVSDLGMYFLANEGGTIRAKRWNSHLLAQDSTFYEGFFDPGQKTVYYSHGWQAGAVKKHAFCQAGRNNLDVFDPRGDLSTETMNVAKPWLAEGWNVVLFFWTQYADDGFTFDLTPLPDLVSDPAVPIRPSLAAAKKIYNPFPTWISEDGWPSLDPFTSQDPIGVQFAKLVVSIEEGFQYNQPAHSQLETRFIGHSLGSMMVHKATEWLSDTANHQEHHLPTRIGMLDPAFDDWFLDYFDSLSVDLYPPIEWYQTSRFDVGFRLIQPLAIPGNDSYSQAIRKTTYTRIFPAWIANPTAESFFHNTAIRVYFNSIHKEQPKVSLRSNTQSLLNPLPFSCDSTLSEIDDRILLSLISIYPALGITETTARSCFDREGTRDGPSAAASLSDLRKYRGDPLYNIDGISPDIERWCLAYANKNDEPFDEKNSIEAHEEHTDILACKRLVLSPGFYAKSDSGSNISIQINQNCSTCACEDSCLEEVNFPFIEGENPIEEMPPEITQEILPHTMMGLDSTLSSEWVEQIKVYPSPFEEELTVEFPSFATGSFQIKVLDLFGKATMNNSVIQKNNLNTLNHRLTTQHLPSGVYFIVIMGSSGEQALIKVMKE